MGWRPWGLGLVNDIMQRICELFRLFCYYLSRWAIFLDMSGRATTREGKDRLGEGQDRLVGVGLTARRRVRDGVVVVDGEAVVLVVRVRVVVASGSGP